jgi:citrate synthase
MANITWDRALGYALERPKSVTVSMLEKWGDEGGRPEVVGKTQTLTHA